MFGRQFSPVLLLVLSLVPAEVVAADRLLVDAQQLACVADNAEDYLKLKRPVFVVVFSECPDPRLSGGVLAADAENSSVPSFDATSSEFEIQDAVPLRADEIVCLADLYSELSNFSEPIDLLLSGCLK